MAVMRYAMKRRAERPSVPMYDALAIESLPHNPCMHCDTPKMCAQYQTCLVRYGGMSVDTMEKQAAERERLKRIREHSKASRPHLYSKFEPE